MAELGPTSVKKKITKKKKKGKIVAVVINNTLEFFSKTLATPNYIQITALLSVLISGSLHCTSTIYYNLNRSCLDLTAELKRPLAVLLALSKHEVF